MLPVAPDPAQRAGASRAWPRSATGSRGADDSGLAPSAAPARSPRAEELLAEARGAGDQPPRLGGLPGALRRDGGAQDRADRLGVDVGEALDRVRAAPATTSRNGWRSPSGVRHQGSRGRRRAATRCRLASGGSSPRSSASSTRPLPEPRLGVEAGVDRPVHVFVGEGVGIVDEAARHLVLAAERRRQRPPRLAALRRDPTRRRDRNRLQRPDRGAGSPGPPKARPVFGVLADVDERHGDPLRMAIDPRDLARIGAPPDAQLVGREATAPGRREGARSGLIEWSTWRSARWTRSRST